MRRNEGGDKILSSEAVFLSSHLNPFLWQKLDLECSQSQDSSPQVQSMPLRSNLFHRANMKDLLDELELDHLLIEWFLVRIEDRRLHWGQAASVYPQRE